MPEIAFAKALPSGMPPELVVRFDSFTLVGTSVAARATAFAVPELGVALDVGRLSPAITAQPVLLLSHAHLDHLSGLLAWLNVRARFHGGEPTGVVCPRGMAEPLQQALEIMPGMESVRRRLDLSTVIRGVDPGQEIELRAGVAVPFAVEHGVEALGWRLFARSGGRALLAYAGDGTTEPFLRAPELLDATTAVVECTFLERNRRIAARLAAHSHLLDWVEVAPRLTCDHLVLAHLPPLDRAAIEELTATLAAVFRGQLVAWTAAAE